jgi:hypothetical protein
MCFIKSSKKDLISIDIHEGIINIQINEIEVIENHGIQNDIVIEIDASFPTLTHIPYDIHNILSEFLLTTLVI